MNEQLICNNNFSCLHPELCCFVLCCFLIHRENTELIMFIRVLNSFEGRNQQYLSFGRLGKTQLNSVKYCITREKSVKLGKSR